MLKIKDFVNLKELEKFGFEYYKDNYGNRYVRNFEFCSVEISALDRMIVIITCNAYLCLDEELNVLFDLMQAGFVEDGKEQ